MRNSIRASKLGLLAMMAVLVPARHWRRAAALTARPLGRRTGDPDAFLYQRVLGQKLDLDCARRAWRREAQLQILGLACRPRAKVEVSLEGEQNIREALARGHGAVLWMSGFASAYLVTKIALWRHGFRVHQLSRPEHGFGSEPLDMSFFNPLWRRVEDRFLASRVMIENDDTKPALTRLRAVLADKGIVKITVGNHGRQVVDVPFLDGTIRLATGPIALARRAGAPLLPVHTVGVGAREFLTTVAPALPVDADGVDPFWAAAEAYAASLAPWVRAYPEQWTGWCDLIPRATPGAEPVDALHVAAGKRPAH